MYRARGFSANADIHSTFVEYYNQNIFCRFFLKKNSIFNIHHHEFEFVMIKNPYNPLPENNKIYRHSLVVLRIELSGYVLSVKTMSMGSIFMSEGVTEWRISLKKIDLPAVVGRDDKLPLLADRHRPVISLGNG